MSTYILVAFKSLVAYSLLRITLFEAVSKALIQQNTETHSGQQILIQTYKTELMFVLTMKEAC